MRAINKFLVVIAVCWIAGAARSQVARHPAMPMAAVSSAQKITSRPLAHVAVSSKIRSAAKRAHRNALVIKRFVAKGPGQSIIASHSTDIKGKSGSIAFTFDVGTAIATSSRVTVSNAPPGLNFSNIMWPALTGTLPSGVSVVSSQKAGSPEYPMLEVTFAIPASARNITPSLQPLTSTPLSNIHLPPAPMLVNKKTFARTFDAKSYQSGWSPTISIGKPVTFRSLRTVTVRIPIASGSGAQINALRKFKIGITFEFNGQPTSGAVRDPLFAGLNAHVAANSWDLAKFAVPLKPSRPIPMLVPRPKQMTPQGKYDSTSFGWIDPNAVYVKLSITRDGLYRVTPAQIKSGTDGFDIVQQQWTPQNIRCINRGVEIPIWIDTDANGNVAAIEFYGQHLLGFADWHEYYNVATDTNAYWLTISNHTGGTPLRYRPVSPQPASTSITSGNILLHHERDFFYYLGDVVGQDELTQFPTEYVPGERFYWHQFTQPNGTDTSRLLDTFYVATLPANTSGKAATVSIFVRGMSYDDHRILVRLNGGQINDLTFNGHDSIVFNSVVPLSSLHVGANVLEVLSAGTGSQIDEFYLDYYNVSFEGGLSPSIDSGIAKGQWLFSVTPGSQSYQLAMNASDIVHLYNLSNATRIVPQSGAYFDSTLLSQNTYTGATANSILNCDRISIWNIPGKPGWQILNPQHQADYIIITHPDFLGDAQRLADRRQAAGLRSMVVTTDEVYNAFDFGSNEPDAIRRFLNYAYYYYSGTPVAYVTLFGAASWDPKFNQNNTLQDPGARATKRSFVPTYGNPVSDFYFTLAEDGELDTIQPHMIIARIPVATTQEADAYLTKVVEYESAAPAEWNHHFLFIAGGSSIGEHQEFMNEIQTFTGTGPGQIGLNGPPMNIRDTIIEKSVDTDYTDNSHVGEIESDIRQGLGVVHFAGHGATFISDVVLPDASNLHNQGLYPLLLTGSCRTGAFAEYNLITLNESYIRQPEAGAIMTFGTTGFGEINFDYWLSWKFFSLMDSFRYMHDYPRINSDTTKPELMNMTALL
ncbi:MAG TPA: C25 family cysteine peptidase, partial [Candidatus Kapabacteria bacterium]|nr:C25 family cysteine peptidase [Candidatus Kapabacteria bacterium]